MATSVGWPGVRPVKTCTECKQSKLRCDSKDRFPNPCSRCQARNLTCTVDPSFRRTPARKRLEAMSKELQELRDQRLAEGARASSATSPDADTNRSRDTSVSASQSLAGILLDDFEFLGHESFELGPVVVSKQSVVEIFNLFVTLYCPHMPILGPISLNGTYQSQPFLFWTIVIIVALRSPVPSDENLFTRLRDPYMQMLRGEILRSPMPLGKIQALLFLCTWPLPVSSQRDDPSWLYCGIAVNAALYMGLHRSNPKAGDIPSFYSIGVVAGSAHERNNTWLGCFYVSTSLSMHYGVPPMINTPSDLAHIRTLLSEHTVPRGFALQIRALLIKAGFTNVLAHDSNDVVVDSSITHLLDSELDTLKANFPEGWTSMTEFTIMVVKMYVYSLVITRSRAGMGSREILLKLGLAAALRSIYIGNSRYHETQDKLHNMTVAQRERTLPKDYFRGLAFATVFLIRYFVQYKGSNAEEQQLAANHVIMAHSIFKGVTLHPRDEYGRAAALFETLCKQAPIPTDTSKPSLADRMGATLIVDAINTARTLRGAPLEITEPEVPIANTTESLAAPSAVESQDVFNSTSHLLDPWPSDLAFANEFWSDLSWDVFNVNGGTLHFSPSHQGHQDH
ncbi:fungal-specific transcription factor domain-containing protein [Durotheca rogersii]|uniref:fungal-specific transcription factor domain-containing protein n=1 Tax=Durotheca rogersii TaxID=419775 RepID=UPI00221ECD8F|nr:fungal-specific transcription factor domain-containing protein [Durotheca rogersii]KAI5860998.1 fungal-specific transcription factor domain-containing protein [Durotheca rogersii]